MAGNPSAIAQILQAAAQNPRPQPQQQQPAPDPYAQAVTEAKQKYPRFANIPIKLTTGSGPGWSETYEPDDKENPHPGNWTVQLRSDEAKNGKVPHSSTVGFEMIHALQANDPQYQKMTDQFVKSMTPSQLSSAKQAYQRDKKVFGTTESFDKWLPRVQAQEYIRGGIFTDVIPNWVGPKGEGQYTPQQTQLLGQIKNYLQTPASNGQQTDQRK